MRFKPLLKGASINASGSADRRGHDDLPVTVKLSTRIRAADQPRVIAFSAAKADRQSCAEPAMRTSVRLILQPAKGEIEILHEAGIPTSQTTGGA